MNCQVERSGNNLVKIGPCRLSRHHSSFLPSNPSYVLFLLGDAHSEVVMQHHSATWNTVAEIAVCESQSLVKGTAMFLLRNNKNIRLKV